MARQPATPFQIPVSDLLHDTGRRRTVHVDASVDWALELSSVEPEPPLHASVVLEAVAGGLVARGRIGFTASHSCNRCTTGWTEELEIEMTELLGADPDDEYPLEGEVADLERPLRDAVLLALPLVPLCRPDCAGLCAVCGADLNTAPCSGHEDESDSPFAALRGLLEP